MTKTKGGGRDGAENVPGGCDIGMQRQWGYPPAAAAGGGRGTGAYPGEY